MDLEILFQDLLASMKLRPELRKLIREAVRIAWEKKKAVNEDVLSAARKRVGALQAKREKVIEAWIDKRISKDIYDDQMRKVGNELEAAGLEEGEAFIDLAEAELLLDFADWMLENASGVWASASFDSKQRIQRSVFPGGLTVSKEGFGTPEIASLFMELEKKTSELYSMASPGGFEPPLPP